MILLLIYPPVFKNICLFASSIFVDLQWQVLPLRGQCGQAKPACIGLSPSILVKTSATCFRKEEWRWKHRKMKNIQEKMCFCALDKREMEANRSTADVSGQTLPVSSTGSSPFISPNTLAKRGQGGERLNYHKKAAAFIETCYWRAKITLNNNNPPPCKPIKCRQQTLGLPTALLEATEVGLNDTW